ncbi:unnamed protein product [Penicillium glandicola]
MNSIHILLSLLLVHIAAAQPKHIFGDFHGHSLKERGTVGPGSDGICYTYTIQQGDNCAKLAERYQITTSNIETWNTGAWGWSGCANVKQGDFVCLSTGALPMPVALPHAVCGPQVPGTRRPSNYADLASLNSCSSNQCCASSGQCGTTSAFCDASQACIFNCGAKTTQKETTTKSTTSKTTTTIAKTTTATTKRSTTTTTTKTTTTTAKTTTTTSKKTTTTAKTTTTQKAATKVTSSVNPTQTWQIAIYEKDNCEGGYFLAQGHESQDPGHCLVLADNTDTDVSDTTTSCRWWTDGGINWGTCASSTLTKPKSWYLTTGTCYVYKGSKCVNEDWIGEVYVPDLGCQTHKTGYLSPNLNKVWGSLQCYDYDAEGSINISG